MRANGEAAPWLACGAAPPPAPAAWAWQEACVAPPPPGAVAVTLLALTTVLSLPAGGPSEPQNVLVQPGMTTLTVTWARPATDAAASYTLAIYAEGGDRTYDAAAKTYAGVPFAQPSGSEAYAGQLTVNGDAYTFVLPDGHGLTPGEGWAALQAESMHSRRAVPSGQHNTCLPVACVHSANECPAAALSPQATTAPLWKPWARRAHPPPRPPAAAKPLKRSWAGREWCPLSSRST